MINSQKSSALIRSDDNDESLFEDDDVSMAIGSTGEITEEDGRHDTKQEEDNIAKYESRAVTFVRFLVVFLLFAVTAGVAVGVYFYVSNQETDSFEDDFNDSAEKAFDAIGSVLDRSLKASDSLMNSAITYQQYNNLSWPFVTVPNFSVEAQKILALSRASAISIYPKVLDADRSAWEEYAHENQGWIDESLLKQKENPFFTGAVVEGYQDFPHINLNGGVAPNFPKYYPGWQASPVVPRGAPWGFDLLQSYGKEIIVVEESRHVVMGQTWNIQPIPEIVLWISDLVGDDDFNTSEPLFSFYYPIVANASDAVVAAALDPESHEVVGVIVTTIFWRKVFEDMLAPGSQGLVVVVGSDCNQTLTFQVNGPNVNYLGGGDLHDSDYDQYVKSSYVSTLGGKAMRERKYSGFPLSTEYCPYWIELYPSNTMKQRHESNDPIIFTVVTVCIFMFTALFFLIYDCVSERRQKKVLQVALQSTALVSNLFPQVVRDRIFPSQEKKAPKERISTAKLRLQQFLRSDESATPGTEVRTSHVVDNGPIAELFSDTTVMFADIAGFTAWSSVREPTQVFTLLETLYGAFDKLAARRGVFKVETIGDSYVAVAGLPEPRVDHAAVMAKFARDIREKTCELVEKLGRTLGPDTADLEVRIGLNSGPVTAGVLRGERSRFQLFGDTVNTAARMESTGISSKIHISQSTADLLVKAGKSHWITKRDGEVEAKGKGRVQTYWVEPTSRGGMSASSGQGGEDDLPMPAIDEKTRRLVEWNFEIMVKLLKQIGSRREAREALGRRGVSRMAIQSKTKTGDSSKGGTFFLDEVKEVIMLPEFDPALAKASRTAKPVQLSTEAMTQLREFISIIATMYPNNPFHNFEHASHVTMSVVKLLSRIIAPSESVIQTAEETKGAYESTLHDHTYGITSDPLTQFACVFSALIHDVDHPGVPNTQLIKEGSPLVEKYRGKSLAEQNSVEISWRLLMEDQFEDFRNVICNTEVEMARFRELVVNGVMATDIMDKDLKSLRNQRWDKAFAEGSRLGESQMVNTNRKATIVIEHLIQASDVAHTMQHWHIFRKWNERLFDEMYAAYKHGRAEKNPAEFWYKGEIGFFDFYVIPLVKKLSDCGVFGVSSDEYLSYAMKNREEWENRGQEMVAAMISKYEVPKQLVSEEPQSSDGHTKPQQQQQQQQNLELTEKEQKKSEIQPTTSSTSDFVGGGLRPVGEGGEGEHAPDLLTV
ncbi:hypothetical protein ACA910_010482 [Epithemia clementina (nom. ined.)]